MMKVQKIIVLIAFFCATNFFAQNSYYQTIVNQVNYDNIYNHLVEFENFGVKEMGTTAQVNTLNWLKENYTQMGYTNIEEQPVYVNNTTGYNLIITKNGTVYPNTFVIVDGHYDTLVGAGVNDNGSGTAAILEIARILKDVPTEYSIKFIHFTAEERGLIGSQTYVEQIAVPNNLDIRLVFNIDQVGGVANEVNNTVVCERDQGIPNTNNEASNIFTNELVQYMQNYSNLNTEIGPAYSSDYMPFQSAGFIITGLYESNESSYPHSSNDSLENMDPQYLYEITKGATGAVLHFAKAQENLLLEVTALNELKVYPNPANEFLTVDLGDNRGKQIELKLYNLLGQIVYKQKTQQNISKIKVKNLPLGTYLLEALIGKKLLQKKVIITH